MPLKLVSAPSTVIAEESAVALPSSFGGFPSTHPSGHVIDRSTSDPNVGSTRSRGDDHVQRRVPGLILDFELHRVRLRVEPADAAPIVVDVELGGNLGHEVLLRLRDGELLRVHLHEQLDRHRGGVPRVSDVRPRHRAHERGALLKLSRQRALRVGVGSEHETRGGDGRRRRRALALHLEIELGAPLIAHRPAAVVVGSRRRRLFFFLAVDSLAAGDVAAAVLCSSAEIRRVRSADVSHLFPRGGVDDFHSLVVFDLLVGLVKLRRHRVVQSFFLRDLVKLRLVRELRPRLQRGKVEIQRHRPRPRRRRRESELLLRERVRLRLRHRDRRGDDADAARRTQRGHELVVLRNRRVEEIRDVAVDHRLHRERKSGDEAHFAHLRGDDEGDRVDLFQPALGHELRARLLQDVAQARVLVIVLDVRHSRERRAVDHLRALHLGAHDDEPLPLSLFRVVQRPRVVRRFRELFRLFLGETRGGVLPRALLLLTFNLHLLHRLLLPPRRLPGLEAVEGIQRHPELVHRVAARGLRRERGSVELRRLLDPALLHAEQAHVEKRGVVIALKLQREKEVLLRVHGVPFAPLHDADVRDRLGVVRVALEREEILLHRAFRPRAHHLKVSEFYKRRAVLRVDVEALLEALLRGVDRVIARVEHPQVEVRLQRAMLQLRGLLEVLLRVVHAPSLRAEETEIIPRLEEKLLLLERGVERLRRGFEVPFEHVRDAQVRVGDREQLVFSNRNLERLHGGVVLPHPG
eukprot:29916-Pelagococcus_subviridis.AAC.2